MSNTQHADATLEGFEGPFFPRAINRLRTELDQAELNRKSALERVAGSVPTYKKLMLRKDATTSDGYCWYCGLIFGAGEGVVVILIPWNQDFKRTDGTNASRAIAVYTQNTSMEMAETIVYDLMQVVAGQTRQEGKFADAYQRRQYGLAEPEFGIGRVG